MRPLLEKEGNLLICIVVYTLAFLVCQIIFTGGDEHGRLAIATFAKITTGGDDQVN
jgi:hypothetical protein